MGSTSKRRRIFPVLASSATMAPRYPVTPSVVMPTKTRFLKTAGEEKTVAYLVGVGRKLEVLSIVKRREFPSTYISAKYTIPK